MIRDTVTTHHNYDSSNPYSSILRNRRASYKVNQDDPETGDDADDDEIFTQMAEADEEANKKQKRRQERTQSVK